MATAKKVKGISPKHSLRESAQRIIITRFGEMMSYKGGAMDGTDIEYVHDMRVSSRRLRAAMHNFADCFRPKKTFRAHLKQVEKITSAMGDVRDFDVLIDKFKKDLARLSDLEQISVKKLIDHLKTEREIKRQPMIEMFNNLDNSGFAIQFLGFFSNQF